MEGSKVWAFWEMERSYHLGFSFIAFLAQLHLFQGYTYPPSPLPIPLFGTLILIKNSLVLISSF